MRGREGGNEKQRREIGNGGVRSLLLDEENTLRFVRDSVVYIVVCLSFHHFASHPKPLALDFASLRNSPISSMHSVYSIPALQDFPLRPG